MEEHTLSEDRCEDEKSQAKHQDANDKNQPKSNCYMLTGEKIRELRISQIQVGSKSKTFFDRDFGWQFSDKEHAETIAKKYSKNGCKIKVRAFFSEKAQRKWHGTKLEKKAVGIETVYLIKKQEVEDKENIIRIFCHQQKFDFSFLYEKSPPDDFEDSQKKSFIFIKPQFEELVELREGCNDLKNALSSIEEEILLEKNSLTTANDWPFTVLGYNNKREIILWHHGDT